MEICKSYVTTMYMEKRRGCHSYSASMPTAQRSVQMSLQLPAVSIQLSDCISNFRSPIFKHFVIAQRQGNSYSPVQHCLMNGTAIELHAKSAERSASLGIQ